MYVVQCYCLDSYWGTSSLTTIVYAISVNVSMVEKADYMLS